MATLKEVAMIGGRSTAYEVDAGGRVGGGKEYFEEFSEEMELLVTNFPIFIEFVIII